MYHLTCTVPIKYRELGVNHEYTIGDILNDCDGKIHTFANFDKTWITKWKMKHGKCFKIVNTRAKNPD